MSSARSAQHKQKELRRYVRRLGDVGALLFTTATEPETVAAAIENFFALETRRLERQSRHRRGLA